VIDAIFQSIAKTTFECVFQEWMDRLAQCCVKVGGSVEGPEKSLRMIQVLLDPFRGANSPTPDSLHLFTRRYAPVNNVLRDIG
jgi:hypothetical protein